MSAMEWPVDKAGLPPVEGPEEEERLQAAVDTATMVLWRLTGAQYALQRLRARPCARVQDWEHEYTSGAGIRPAHGMTPTLYGGRWHNLACSGGSCQSDGLSSVRLPGPVAAVLEVEVEGEVLSADSYAVEGDRVKRALGLPWPRQDLQRPLGEPGTWSVLYYRGIAPPAGAGTMVAILAKELYLQATGAKGCRLPKNWQSVTRQGVSVQRANQADLLQHGTGLPEVDLWVKALNPHGVSGPSRVASVDTLGGR